MKRKQQLYDRPVRVLMKEMVDELVSLANQSFTKQEAILWFKEHYPKVKSTTIVAHLLRLSTNVDTRLHYSATPADDVLFKLDSNNFRRYDPQNDPPAIHGHPVAHRRKASRVSDDGRVEDMPAFITKLIGSEPKSIIRTLAFMSYNPSIGRVLEAGGVKTFQKIAEELVDDLQTPQDFDRTHRVLMSRLIRDIKTAKGKPLSYGQAQKPLNVFLKVYVDWAHKPSSEIRDRLIPFLHVPLDSVLMKTIKNEFPDSYSREIKPYVRDSQRAFSLVALDADLYNKWQEFFRARHQQRPLIFDIAWELNRHLAS